MDDSLLFKKIAERLFEMCKENQIGVITYFEVDVHSNSHVNKNSLLTHLIDEIPELVNYDTNLRINKGETEPFIAVVKKIEGVCNETVCD